MELPAIHHTVSAYFYTIREALAAKLHNQYYRVYTKRLPITSTAFRLADPDDFRIDIDAKTANDALRLDGRERLHLGILVPLGEITEVRNHRRTTYVKAAAEVIGRYAERFIPEWNEYDPFAEDEPK